jgi:hypothetical protein
MDPNQYLGWLALALTPGLGARMAGKLLRDLGSPEAIFNSSLTELEAQRLPVAVAQALHTRQPLSAAAKELAQAQAAGVRLLTWDEPEYPQRLREIYDPPPLLYVRGNVELLNRHLISIGGSRRPTPDGNQMAEKLAKDLAARGLVIVSGLARGIDSSAHQGALSSSSGSTIGVRDRRDLPQGEQEDFRGDGEARGDHFGIRNGHVSGAAESSDPQSRHIGNVDRRGGSGRRAVLGIADYGTTGDGIRLGGVRRAGERDAADQFRTKPC